MADRPNPYVRKDPGDIIRSGDWNELQVQAREEIRKLQVSTREEIRGHTHTGDEDGKPIPRKGIADSAINGDKIDPAAKIEVSTLKVTDTLVVEKPVAMPKGSTIEGTVPRGAVMPFYLETSPNGWAPCDGQTWGLDANGKAVTAGYIEGTQLPTPDLRGIFIRCLDDLKTNGPAHRDPEIRSLGQIQKSELMNHSHTAQAVSNHDHGFQAVSDHDHGFQAAGDHKHDTGPEGDNKDNVGTGYIMGYTNKCSSHETVSTTAAGGHGHNFKAGGNHNHNFREEGAHTHAIDPYGGSETRPVNIALFFCIKL